MAIARELTAHPQERDVEAALGRIRGELTEKQLPWDNSTFSDAVRAAYVSAAKTIALATRGEPFDETQGEPAESTKKPFDRTQGKPAGASLVQRAARAVRDFYAPYTRWKWQVLIEPLKLQLRARGCQVRLVSPVWAQATGVAAPCAVAPALVEIVDTLTDAPVVRAAKRFGDASTVSDPLLRSVSAYDIAQRADQIFHRVQNLKNVKELTAQRVEQAFEDLIDLMDLADRYVSLRVQSTDEIRTVDAVKRKARQMVTDTVNYAIAHVASRDQRDEWQWFLDFEAAPASKRSSMVYPTSDTSSNLYYLEVREQLGMNARGTVSNDTDKITNETYKQKGLMELLSFRYEVANPADAPKLEKLITWILSSRSVSWEAKIDFRYSNYSGVPKFIRDLVEIEAEAYASGDLSHVRPSFAAWAALQSEAIPRELAAKAKQLEFVSSFYHSNAFFNSVGDRMVEEVTERFEKGLPDGTNLAPSWPALQAYIGLYVSRRLLDARETIAISDKGDIDALQAVVVQELRDTFFKNGLIEQEFRPREPRLTIGLEYQTSSLARIGARKIIPFDTVFRTRVIDGDYDAIGNRAGLEKSSDAVYEFVLPYSHSPALQILMVYELERIQARILGEEVPPEAIIHVNLGIPSSDDAGRLQLTMLAAGYGFSLKEFTPGLQSSIALSYYKSFYNARGSDVVELRMFQMNDEENAYQLIQFIHDIGKTLVDHALTDQWVEFERRSRSNVEGVGINYSALLYGRSASFDAFSLGQAARYQLGLMIEQELRPNPFVAAKNTGIVAKQRDLISETRRKIYDFYDIPLTEPRVVTKDGKKIVDWVPE